MIFLEKGGLKRWIFGKKRGGHTNPKNLVADFSTSRKRGGGSEAVWKFSENSSKMVHTIVPKFGESPLHCTGDSDECFLHSTDFADISPHSQLKYPDDYNMKLLYGGKIKIIKQEKLWSYNLLFLVNPVIVLQHLPWKLCNFPNYFESLFETSSV